MCCSTSRQFESLWDLHLTFPPHPFPVFKLCRAAAYRTKEKTMEEGQGHTSAAFHTFLSLPSQASGSCFSLKQLNNCKLYTNWLNLWPSALVIIWNVWPGKRFLGETGWRGWRNKKLCMNTAGSLASATIPWAGKLQNIQLGKRGVINGDSESTRMQHSTMLGKCRVSTRLTLWSTDL